MRSGFDLMRDSVRIAALVIAACPAGGEVAGPGDAAMSGARMIVDARLRFEHVDQDAVANDANAATLRARLGFESAKVWNTRLLMEGEFVSALDGDYDSTTNGATAYPVVPDPQSHELNRLQLENTSIPLTTFTVGRQRILLDDQRFVGNVGWRQNEQTFDSVRMVNRSVRNLVVDVAYLDQVNRVFGKESRQGRYRGDSLLANVSWQFPAGKLTGFGYRLEFESIDGVPAAVRDSSATYGVRFSGERALGQMRIAYAASYANQREQDDNPLSFDLDYRFAELSGIYRRYSLGGGIEILEGDAVKGFTTPLATLHKFQGWADKFASTPANGIDDRYLKAGYAVQRLGPLDALSAVASHHWYRADRTALEYGSEMNVQIEARWQRFSGLIKYADYEAHRLLADTTKFWVQLEYAW